MVAVMGVNSKALRQGNPEPLLLPGKMRLYSMRFCPFAERVLIYVAKKNLAIEVININLMEPPAWYFNKHPQGKVPALEHDGKSGIIPEYLDAIFPDSSILPVDPFQRALQRILIEQLNTAEKLATVEKTFNDVEKRLLVNDFFAGASAGYADYLSFPFFERFYHVAHCADAIDFDVASFPDKQRFPKLTKWFASMRDLDEVRAVAQSPEVVLKFFESHREGKPNYDAGIKSK